MNVVAITHLLCAAVFGAVALLLLAGRQRNRNVVALASSCIATVIWALAVAAGGRLPASVIAVVESARDGVWLCFMLSLLAAPDRTIPRWAKSGVTATIGIAVAALGIDLASLVLDPTSPALSQPQILARICIAVVGLSLVENYYRNTTDENRWAAVPLTIAVGAMFAFELFFYADVQLSRQTDASFLAARALANVLSVPLILLGLKRNAKWRTDFRLSHNAAFHAVTLVACGVFLLSVAIVGALFRRYGGQWGMVLQVTSLFGSAIVLATILSSETARSGIRMAVMRNFFSYRYDYRVEWLRCIEALSAGGAMVDLPERVVRTVADIVNSPGGVLFQRHDNDKVFVPCAFWNAHVPSQAREAADSAFVAGFRDGRWIQELGAGDDAVAAGRPDWLEEMTKFWLAVPLLHQDELIGFVLLVKPRAPVNPDWEVFDLLRTVARQAASYLSEQQAERALADAHMLQEYSQRFAFVVHDIKNLSSQLGLILSNARRHGSNPEFQADVMHTVENSVARMNKLLSQLKVATAGGSLVSGAAAAAAVPAVADALSIVRELASAHPHADNIDIVCAWPSVRVKMDGEPLRSVLAHLLDNAVEASGAGGKVTVSLSGTDDGVTIDITDRGPGMEASFVRDVLFRPFRSTKDSGFGIGAYQTRELVRAAGGQLEVITKPGAGTTMRVALAAAPDFSHVSPAA